MCARTHHHQHLATHCRAELEYEAALERRRQELEAERLGAEQQMLKCEGTRAY